MPFIEEEKFKLMQEDFDNAKLKREEAEDELTKVQDDFKSFKKKSKITPILFGILFGLAAALAYYFYTNGGGTISDSEIASIKKKEATRVLDSIQRAQARAKRSNKGGSTNDDTASTSTDNAMDTATFEGDVDNATQGETVYSVQVGVFSDKKYPLLSSSYTPGIAAPNGSYFKYSLGLYSSLAEARKLRGELRNIGFKDAFVASYVNGKRQKIHH
ncbi:SPOR domain-containing protein [uncultured Tenacibaculum sp.]|uniref:SPOR domain-containing protein n=1 Tax=uncultured Tenacibaculum sp. TaxID=174713 RepID=UPI002611C5D1|nr:SPOR domain-containing protein [uncultured Tenacibaculum sp.]